MKPYKFLVPVAIAAGALAGNAAKANAITQPEARVEQAADYASAAAAAQSFVQKYTVNGEEHTLLLRLGNQGVLYAQHVSHSSHSSHSSHHSHHSHSSHTSGV
jgi:hypothetical protein